MAALRGSVTVPSVRPEAAIVKDDAEAASSVLNI